MVLSGNLWPVHIKPFSGELLSSWLVRIARSHGLLLHTFCDIAWPKKPIWNRDIDKSADIDLLSTLGQKTSMHENIVFQTTLRKYEGIVYEHHNPNGNTKWILPVGIYHRLHKRAGLQYCPLCLAEDRDPYYRTEWRLASSVICKKHRIRLLDSCPICNSPINYHRIKDPEKSITTCYLCGYDLSKNRKKLYSVNQKYIQLQKIIDQSIYTGIYKISDNNFIYSFLYFDVLRQIMKLFLYRNHTRDMVKYIGTYLFGRDCLEHLIVRKSEPDNIDINNRYVLLMMAVWILLKWPNRFIDLCNKFNVTYWLAVKDMHAIPFWYWHVVRSNLYEGGYIPSIKEVDSVIYYLLRNDGSIRRKSVSRMLGMTDIYRKRGNILESRFFEIINKPK